MQLHSRPLSPRAVPLDVVREICELADFQTLLLSIAPASRDFRELVSSELVQRHKNLLNDFAQNRQAFRSLMRRHHAVIGGAAVLKMFCPSFDNVDHYDIYVPLRAIDDFVDHLLYIEEYTVVMENTENTAPISMPLDDQHPCSHPPLQYRSGVARLVVLQRASRVVHVVASGNGDVRDCATLPIAFSWSTLFFNYASADSICSAYPSLTFAGRGLWHFDRVLDQSFPEGTNPIELNKYGALGFEFQRWAEEWDRDSFGRIRTCARSWCCPFALRSFADRGSFRLLLGPYKTTSLDIRWVFGGYPYLDVCDHPIAVPPVVHYAHCQEGL